MNLTATYAGGRPRFEALLAGTAKAVHDQPLLARSDWVVAPTLGAIVPGWLLLIPRAPFLNFRDWSRYTGQQPETLIEDVQNHLGLSPDDILWFEHGPHAEGTTIGCGLDHAHIHILVRPSFSFDAFRKSARDMADLDWREGGPELGYSALGAGASYLIAGTANRVLRAGDVAAVGSQFFRRVVATTAAVQTDWDYRQSPQLENVASTVRTFQRLESRRQRER